METIFKQDLSFINVSYTGGTKKDLINNDIISVTVDEEIQKFVTGQITFLDQSNYYSKEFRQGTRFNLVWGYKKRNESIIELGLKTLNPKELISPEGVRRGLQCVVSNESGGGDQGGQKTYNCRFFGYEFSSNILEAKIYYKGNYEFVIRDNLRELGVRDDNMFIDFNKGKQGVGHGVRRDSSQYKFLVTFAYELNCLFLINYNTKGEPIALFTDGEKVHSAKATAFMQQIVGGFGNSKTLEYGEQSFSPNVLSYTWQHHEGENGQGDQVDVQVINGQSVITRRVTENKKVTVYTLNEVDLKKFLSEHKEQDNEITVNILKAGNLDAEVYAGRKIRSFFKAQEIGTCPQGFGFSISASMIGDPAMTVPVEIKFTTGFPQQLTQENKEADGKPPVIAFFVKKVSHNLSRDGYKMSVEIADNIVIWGAFIRGDV